MYKISYEKLSGEVVIPTSKSTAHRAIVIALLKKDVTKIYDVNYCDDVVATINICRAINCKIDIFDNYIIVDSSDLKYTGELLDCNESGTTLRFMLLIILHLFEIVNITGSEKLMSRPLDGYDELFKLNEIKVSNLDNKIMAQGKLETLTFMLDNSKSSQFVSAILMIAPFYNQNKFELMSITNSVGYVDITMDLMSKFSQDIKRESFLITLKQKKYDLEEYKNEVDESAYPFFKTLELVNHDIKILNTNDDSKQPDRKFIDLINLSVIDINETPDLLPIILVYKLLKNEETIITNISRARYKESNRVENLVCQLIDQGYNIKIIDDEIHIFKSIANTVLKLSSFNDHRLAMAYIILASNHRYIYLDNIKCIDKSYVSFIDDFITLGGHVIKIDK